ncbi:MAG: hypothetical protein WD651_09625 [Acidimicrobiia bacterium]
MKATPTFERYAELAEIPEDPMPIHVLLDIDQTQFSATQGKKTVTLQLDDTAHEVKDGVFDITLTDQQGAQTYAAGLKWDAEKSRYHLECDDLRDTRYLQDGEESRELVDVINSEQRLRVIPSARTVVYSHGHFFKPQLPKRSRGSFHLLDILHTDALLAAAVNEKGPVTNSGWGQGTAFGLISALAPNVPFQAPTAMKDIFSSVDFLLCTNTGKPRCVHPRQDLSQNPQVLRQRPSCDLRTGDKEPRLPPADVGGDPSILAMG